MARIVRLAIPDPRAPSTRVTRDVEPAELGDLLANPPRATVAFLASGEVEQLPARARFRGERHEVAVHADAGHDLDGREVVLTRDDGAYWFELRAITVRGIAKRIAAPDESARGLVWYTIEPTRVVAWDYGTLRER